MYKNSEIDTFEQAWDLRATQMVDIDSIIESLASALAAADQELEDPEASWNCKRTLSAVSIIWKYGETPSSILAVQRNRGKIGEGGAMKNTRIYPDWWDR